MLTAMIANKLTTHSRATLSSLSSAKQVALPTGITSRDQIVAVKLQPASQGISFTTDGTTPTASVGTRLDVGMVDFVTDVNDLQIIELAASATVEVTYFIRKGSLG